MKWRILLPVVATTIVTLACNQADPNPARIDLQSVDRIEIWPRPNANDTVETQIRRLTREQEASFIDRWNSASSTGPRKFLPRFLLKVISRNGTTRSFRVSGKYIKENNDWCFDLGDSAYVDLLWRHADPL